jgi:hypothetical protein
MATRLGSTSSLGSIILGIALAGCASVNVQSKKSPDFNRKLDRTLVVFTAFDMFSKSYRQILRDRTLVEFEKRGVTVRFAATPDRLELEDGPSFDAQAKEFNASSALIVRAVGGVVDGAGQILTGDLDAQLYDLASRKRVWRAKIQYSAGGSLNTDQFRVDKLVTGIMSALSADGLLLANVASSSTVEPPQGAAHQPDGT